MIPNRPIPPENPDIPKRGQISLETLRKESIETQLWDLENESDSMRAAIVPVPRSIQQPAPPPETQDPYAGLLPPGAEQDTPNPAATKSTDHHADTIPAHDDFDDLEDLPPPNIALTPPAQSPTPTVEERASATDPIPTTGKNSNRKKSKFSSAELAGIGTVGLLLALCAAYFLFNAFRNLPRTTDPYEMPEFPIKGAYITVTAADSYWRLPVTTGPDADVVSRGTRLIPVIEVVARSENATMRVQFRNSEGTPVGDPVTVPVRGNPIITIPSTSGFEDVNVHNAYRIGMVEPWSVEILEAPASSTSGGAFRLLTTFPIATARR